MKAWIKSRTADKVLTPVRKCIGNLIAHDSSLLDIGCGTGSLLMHVQHKINVGVGVDMDIGMTRFAQHQAKLNNFDHIQFITERLQLTSVLPHSHYDYASATLCLHEMPWEKAKLVLIKMRSLANTIIIADFSQTNSLWGKLSIEVDEIMSGHYTNFKQYRSKGGLNQLANACGLTVQTEHDSGVDGISIWVLTEN